MKVFMYYLISPSFQTDHVLLFRDRMLPVRSRCQHGNQINYDLEAMLRTCKTLPYTKCAPGFYFYDDISIREESCIN